MRKASERARHALQKNMAYRKEKTPPQKKNSEFILLKREEQNIVSLSFAFLFPIFFSSQSCSFQILSAKSFLLQDDWGRNMCIYLLAVKSIWKRYFLKFDQAKWREYRFSKRESLKWTKSYFFSTSTRKWCFQQDKGNNNCYLKTRCSKWGLGFHRTNSTPSQCIEI